MSVYVTHRCSSAVNVETVLALDVVGMLLGPISCNLFCRPKRVCIGLYTKYGKRLHEYGSRLRPVHLLGLVEPVAIGLLQRCHWHDYCCGPLCHALSLSSLASWTSMRRRRATVPLATPGEWA